MSLSHACAGPINAQAPTRVNRRSAMENGRGHTARRPPCPLRCAGGRRRGRDMTLRLGLLSTAKINGAVLAGAAGTDAVDVVAVASRDQARAEAYAAERGIPRAHGSYEALLADPDVDAVYVSLPNSLHVEWAVRALRAGKHVLCEKPLTRRPPDAEAAFDAAERSGRVLAEAFMWRHHPQALRLQELLRDGAVGEV